MPPLKLDYEFTETVDEIRVTVKLGPSVPRKNLDVLGVPAPTGSTCSSLAPHCGPHAATDCVQSDMRCVAKVLRPSQRDLREQAVQSTVSANAKFSSTRASATSFVGSACSCNFGRMKSLLQPQNLRAACSEVQSKQQPVFSSSMSRAGFAEMSLFWA